MTTETQSEIDRMVDRWAWNNTPAECVAEARAAGYSPDDIESAMQRRRYRADEIATVVNAMRPAPKPCAHCGGTGREVTRG